MAYDNIQFNIAHFIHLIFGEFHSSVPIMPSNAKMDERVCENQRIDILAALPFLRIHHNQNANTSPELLSNDATTLLANLIDAIATPPTRQKYTPKFKLVHQIIMLFSKIANDDFLPKQALKIVIAEKISGRKVKHVV